MALPETGRAEEAEILLLDAIAIWESLRSGPSDSDQISLLETQADTYQALQRVQIYLKRFNQALETSERGRARAFLEIVARRFSMQAARQLQISPPKLSKIQQIAR